MVNSSDVTSIQRSKCDCHCGMLAAELEGVKLELVILQKSVEIKIIEAKSHEDEVTQPKAAFQLSVFYTCVHALKSLNSSM